LDVSWILECNYCSELRELLKKEERRSKLKAC
jgi:hypothetical protein